MANALRWIYHFAELEVFYLMPYRKDVLWRDMADLWEDTLVAV